LPKHFQKYLEAYNRALTSRDAEKYAEGEDEVIDMEVLINEVALLRNRWLGILKGLDGNSGRWDISCVYALVEWKILQLANLKHQIAKQAAQSNIVTLANIGSISSLNRLLILSGMVC
jgi:hypothetical protein